MNIEYLLIKQKNDFCNTVEQLKNLLLTNSRIAITENTLSFSGVDFEYSVSAQEVSVKRPEIVFYFHISVAAENDDIASKLEDFDKLLRRINTECGTQFIINTIWDDVSIYYAEKLYPDMTRVENLLRKIIYRFMINISGSTWFDNTVPAPVRESIGETLKKNNMSLDETGEDQLYYADFIQLGQFFFQPYTLKPLTQESIQKIKDAAGGEEGELTTLLEMYTSKSNWDRYFADKISVDDLFSKWRQLYIYRNQVAHTKRVKKVEYEDALSIINELTAAFNSCLNHIDDVEMTEDESQAAKEVAKETVSPDRTVIRGGKKGEVLYSIPSTNRFTIDSNKFSNILEATELYDRIAKTAIPLTGASSFDLLQSASQQRLMDAISYETLLSSTLKAYEPLAVSSEYIPLYDKQLQLQTTLDSISKATQPISSVADTVDSIKKDLQVGKNVTEEKQKKQKN